jgi:hypothetical protein
VLERYSGKPPKRPQHYAVNHRRPLLRVRRINLRDLELLREL